MVMVHKTLFNHLFDPIQKGKTMEKNMNKTEFKQQQMEGWPARTG